MKLRKAIRVLGLVALAGSASSLTLAEDAGWYIGGNLGRTDSRINDQRMTNEVLNTGFTGTVISHDDRDTGFKLFGGYQFNRNFALEGGYFDLGKFNYRAITVPAGTLSGRLKAKGFNLDLVALHNFTEKFAILGRVGASYAKTDVQFKDTGAVHLFDASRDKRAVDYKYGVGLQYALTRSADLRLEAERYRINDAVGNKDNIDMVSLGLVYRFGQNRPEPVKAAYVEPPKVAAPVAVIVPVAETERYCTILDLVFNINKSGIQLEDMEKLGVVGTFLNKYPKTTAIIEGHSDNVGRPEDNLKLSQQRAQSVVDFIVTRHNIDRARLKAVGYGESRPLVSNETPEGMRANRRINAVISCATDIEGLTPAAARLTMALQMEFDSDKANVKPEYRDQLATVAKHMKDHPEVSASVQGHASNRNRVSAAGSMKLSRERALNVANYLVTNFAIDSSRLTAEGFGETNRFAYNTTAEGQQENQRVNIIFTYKR